MEFIDTVGEHFYLLIGIALGLYWIIKRIIESVNAAKSFVNHAIDERMPQKIKDTLSNGGGEIIRKIVRDANDEQSRLHTKELEDRFVKHEAQEEQRFRDIEAEVFPPRRKRR